MGRGSTTVAAAVAAAVAVATAHQSNVQPAHQLNVQPKLAAAPKPKCSKHLMHGLAATGNSTVVAQVLMVVACAGSDHQHQLCQDSHWHAILLVTRDV